MSTPVTQLDQRYSGPEAVAAGWDETRKALEEAELFWITTVRADGRPHVTPLVAVWLDGALHFCTGAGEQKFLNLTANPHVALTTGCNRWDGGLDVVVEGQAAQATDQATLTRLAEAWRTKWDGRWHFEAHDGAFRDSDSHDGRAEVFTVTPTKIYAHAKGEPFGATTHRF
ncbi:MAG TPA: pyridoxamine 5'-phosphate oxidase family protein [Streptosporangiaceae bacterium]|jgi:nitroimidazol reductase NimA-like FMN-containing flavoprotein (pyridoxamine 5'-phosphate oxidase superfamily)|nr:pyridoxamine 5'-phosphate oxidase family protein [Streptosporangiaceae bacterium]